LGRFGPALSRFLGSVTAQEPCCQIACCAVGGAAKRRDLEGKREDSVPSSTYSEPNRSRALRMPRSCGLLCRPACATAGAGCGLSLSLNVSD